MRRRAIASTVAAEALEEAVATESIIRSLRLDFFSPLGREVFSFKCFLMCF